MSLTTSASHSQSKAQIHALFVALWCGWCWAAPASAQVILDPGHGGSNLGAAGPLVFEKSVTLEIAQKTARILAQEFHRQSVLTRTTDAYVSLAERVAVANQNQGQLLVSIHCNSNDRRGSKGFEVFFIDNEGVVEPENRLALEVRKSNIEVVNRVLTDLRIQKLQRLSGALAAAINAALDLALQSPNRGIKQANFNVLYGALMPAVVVEMGFINDRQEGRSLASESYQESVAVALAQGIDAWLVAQKIQPDLTAAPQATGKEGARTSNGRL